MAIDEQVDAGHILQQIDGAVLGHSGLIIDAQVAQAHNDVAALGFQSVHLSLCDLIHVLSTCEAHALNLGGMGFGSGLGGAQTEHADLGAVGGGEHGVVTERQFAVLGDVGGQDGELGFLCQSGQVVITVVKLMVAGCHSVVAGSIHQFHSGLSLRDADTGLALNEVTGIQKEHIGTLGFQLLLHSGDGGITVDRAMHIVGVQDHDAAGQVFFRLGCKGGGHQAEDHDERQQQRQHLLCVFHAFPPMYMNFRNSRKCRGTRWHFCVFGIVQPDYSTKRSVFHPPAQG